jgi:hypothetical protein
MRDPHHDVLKTSLERCSVIMMLIKEPQQPSSCLATGSDNPRSIGTRNNSGETRVDKLESWPEFPDVERSSLRTGNKFHISSDGNVRVPCQDTEKLDSRLRERFRTSVRTACHTFSTCARTEDRYSCTAALEVPNCHHANESDSTIKNLLIPPRECTSTCLPWSSSLNSATRARMSLSRQP